MPDEATSADPVDTRSAEYTARLQRITGARWKRLLRAKAPYHRNHRRWLGERPTIDLGCGIGHNLAHLAPGSIAIDHNPESVQLCRDQGPDRLPPRRLLRPHASPGRFQGLLCAHVVEHIEPTSRPGFLRPYLDLLAPEARVLLICPQQRGYASDPTHVAYLDLDALGLLCIHLGLTVLAQRSFPFSRGGSRVAARDHAVARVLATSRVYPAR